MHLGTMILWQMGPWVSDTEVSESQYCHYIVYSDTSFFPAQVNVINMY